MIYTIGHSTLTEEAFLKIAEPVDVIIDIRSHPGSTKYPQFNKENLEKWIPAAGKKYEWEPRLGGWSVDHIELADKFMVYGVDVRAYVKRQFPKQRIGVTVPGCRKVCAPTELAQIPTWTNQGLLDYAYFTTLPDYWAALHDLTNRQESIAIMCAEVLWWKCHRSMVADTIVFMNKDAVHLQPKLTLHSKAISNRLERYPREVVEIWKRFQ